LLAVGAEPVLDGVVALAFFFETFFFDFLAVVAAAVLSFEAGAGVEGAVCAKEIPASARVIVRAAMVFMMF
jgi:hypothetical protein